MTVVNRLQIQSPNALLIISGDFNHVSLLSSLSTFTQYVTCATRDNTILDLFYANTKEAYKPHPLPTVGRADHNLVFFESVYKPLVHRQPAVTRMVRKWSTEAEDALRDCFDTTRWELFSEVHEEDIDALTDTITDYINFCEENTVPTRTVRCFSNNKPWTNPDIKALLKEKKKAFMSRNREELKAVQIRLRRKIREGKKTYRRKLEDQLQASNVTGVWRGLKTISGHNNSPKTLTEKDKDWADELNRFFNPFDMTSVPSPNHQLHPLSLRTSSPPPPLSTSSQQPSLSPGSCLSVTTEQVRNQLRKMNVRKVAGPDKISSRLLRTCSDQLCDIVQHMFNLSLKLGRAPQVWKTSCLVPVPPP
ncbi:uncharacterized protein LOC109531879 [Hippocampus comes]|uniref:uncharacterized protein LOC109531879 n=1 Tax=Hippocampus comes TaxID=109280 RepID=UPI00094E67C6|nr:PREDICTED: uncharacterized protein LOC109531879 [Hippocampus comes]